MTIRVVIADDHDIAVVGEAHNGHEAGDLALALRPDPVVMDIAMPELSGVEATRQIHAQAPRVRVLALAAPVHLRLLDAVASGYSLNAAESRENMRAARHRRRPVGANASRNSGSPNATATAQHKMRVVLQQNDGVKCRTSVVKCPASYVLSHPHT